MRTSKENWVTVLHGPLDWITNESSATNRHFSTIQEYLGKSRYQHYKQKIVGLAKITRRRHYWVIQLLVSVRRSDSISRNLMEICL